MKQRFVRTGEELADPVTVVVRGGDLDPVALRVDALRNHRIYGTYGISVFAVRDLNLDELAQLPPLIRFASLAILTVGELRTLGLALEPTGRNPRHYDVTFVNLDEGIERLAHCKHEVIVNPYYAG